MNALGFRPSQKFLYKKFLQILVVGFLALSLSILIGSWIGEEIGGTQGALMGRLVALVINFVWLIPGCGLMFPSYRSLFYEIHEDEVVMHTGVFTRRVTHVPIQMITNIEVLRDPFDRALGLGTINIQTASSSEHVGATECFAGLQNFKEVYDHLTSAIKRTRNSTPQESYASHSIEIETLKSLIEELKKIRTLLEAPEHQG